MSRMMPEECEHGRIIDWGDFGDTPEKCDVCDNRRLVVVDLDALDAMIEAAGRQLRELVIDDGLPGRRDWGDLTDYQRKQWGKDAETILRAALSGLIGGEE